MRDRAARAKAWSENAAKRDAALKAAEAGHRETALAVATLMSDLDLAREAARSLIGNGDLRFKSPLQRLDDLYELVAGGVARVPVIERQAQAAVAHMKATADARFDRSAGL